MESNAFIALFLALGIVIAAAQVAGMLARMLGQPRVFGELLAGVILGPTVLNFLSWPVFAGVQPQETIGELAELGVLLLMFNVGLDVHLRELIAVGRVAVLAGALGALAPLALAAPIMALAGYSTQVALFTGVVLAATSVSISAQTLLELGVLRTREGFGLLAAAVVDDVLAILLLSFVVASLSLGEVAAGGEGAGGIGIIVLRMALYIVGALLVSWFILPRVINWLHERHQMVQSVATFALIFALIFGWSAEALGGIAAITGAFIAGLGISRVHDRPKREIETAVRSIAYAFLVPVFFVNVGLSADLRQIGLEQLPLAGLLLLAAIISKVAGCGLGANLGGFTRGESFRLGVCMISRGEVGLIVEALGLSLGVFTDSVFSTLFLVILLTTVLTPVFVRWVFRGAVRPQPQRVQVEGS